MAPPCPAAKSLDPAWWGHGPRGQRAGGSGWGHRPGLRRLGPASCPPGSQHRSRPLWGAWGSPWIPQTQEKDWCLDKDWFQELWASESLSVTPNVFSAQGVHTAPITQLRTVHLPVVCPLRGLPSYDPLAATVGTQTPGMEPGDSRPEVTASPWTHLPSSTGPHYGPSVGAVFSPQGLGSKDHGRLAPGAGV